MLAGITLPCTAGDIIIVTMLPFSLSEWPYKLTGFLRSIESW